MVSRGVRRAWLCGRDPYDGQDYSHRRQWGADRMNQLKPAFAIEGAAYAITCNHYHLLLRVDTQKAVRWLRQQIIEQWHTIYNGYMLSQRFMQGETLHAAECKILQRFAEEWRKRLGNIS